MKEAISEIQARDNGVWKQKGSRMQMERTGWVEDMVGKLNGIRTVAFNDFKLQ